MGILQRLFEFFFRLGAMGGEQGTTVRSSEGVNFVCHLTGDRRREKGK
jgi:hypothetical protein